MERAPAVAGQSSPAPARASVPVGLLVLALLGPFTAGRSMADAEPAPTGAPALEARPPLDAQADRFSSPEPGVWSLIGNVVLRSGEILLQADEVRYDTATRSGEAKGSVLFVVAGTRVSGRTLVFDLDDHTAELTETTGYLEQGLIFRARRVQQLDRDRLRFESGFFTACVQPVPYWSFRVTSGVIVRDRYVHLYNMVLKAGPIPVFYSPWLAFPIKPDRSTGLLLPQFGSSQRLGTSIGNAFFWALRRNQDATFMVDAFSGGSLGGGLEYRFLPNPLGGGVFNGYLIDEEDPEGGDPERRRWNVRFRERQDFHHGGRFLADIDLVSDPDYYLDYARDLDRGSDPAALSRAEYVLTRGFVFFAGRLERREQFFSDATVLQTRLPEAELRMRSRRLGSTPFYLAFDGSASLLEKEAPGFPTGSYGRIDIFPALSAPWAPLPWLNVTPTLRLRETYYTRGLEPGPPPVFGDSQERGFLQFSLETLGPRLSRVGTRADGTGKWRTTIEPRLTYRYQTSPDAEENLRVPVFDEIDALPADLNEIEYGVVSRLFARRLARTDHGTVPTPAPEGSPPVATLPPLLSSPVEIASLSVTQRHSFMAPLSFDLEGVDTDNDGLADATTAVAESRFSPIGFAARYNPAVSASLDARLQWDVLEDTVLAASVSAGLFDPRLGFLSTSYVFRNGLDGLAADSTQLRLTGGTSFLQHRMALAVSMSYDLEQRVLQDQRYRLGYDTQCCGFAVEVLDRDYVGTDQREFRFVVNLRGIGNFLDLQGGGSR